MAQVTDSITRLSVMPTIIFFSVEMEMTTYEEEQESIPSMVKLELIALTTRLLMQE